MNSMKLRLAMKVSAAAVMALGVAQAAQRQVDSRPNQPQPRSPRKPR